MRRVEIIFLLIFTGISASATDLKPLYEEIVTEYKSKNISEAIAQGENVLSLAKAEENDTYIIKTYYLMAFIHSHNDNFGDAIIYYLEGARHAELSSSQEVKSNLISMYKNLALILGDYKHYELSHKFINEGLRVAKSNHNTKQIIELLNNRIHELISEERYEDGLHEIQFLLNNYEVSSKQKVALMNKLGVAYHNLGDTILAIENYETVISNDSGLDPNTYSMTLLNLGNIYMELGNEGKALDYYDQTIRFGEEHQLNIRTIRGFQKKGEAYYNLKKYPEAIENFHIGIERIDSGEETPNSHEIYKQLSTAYTAIGEFESALKYERIYSVKLEEFIQQQKEIEELDKKYNIQLLTERYFDLLAADHEKKETERLAKFGIGGTTVIFLSILFLILYKQQRTKISLARELSQIELNSEV